MAKIVKTSGKPRAKPLNGAADGVPFSANNQPPPEAKKEGWRKLRALRLLTQGIILAMTRDDGKNLNDYIESLIDNAKKGNPKAIETINKGLEEDVLKIAQTDADGNDIDYSKFSEEELRYIASLESKGGIG